MALVAVLGMVVVLAAAAVLCAPPASVTLERAEPPAEGAEVTAEDASTAEQDAPDEAEGESPAPDTVVVHVDGAVVSPGVYELPAGSRAGDAVAAAGGLAEGADTTAINLAAVLADGEKVYVPLEGEAVTSSQEGSLEGGAAPVNLNTATAEELDGLPGIGEATAQAIIEDREANGPFLSPEDLMRVSGIGEKKFERLEGLVCV